MLARSHRAARARYRLLILGAFAGLLGALHGCGPSDPLEKVRGLQDERADFQATLEPLRELLAERPGDPEVQYRYGLALFATGNGARAVYSLREAIESPEWLERAGPVLASALVSTGSFDDAIRVCSRLLEQSPDHVPTLLVRAHARIGSRRDYEGALSDADRVLELDPESEAATAPRIVALLALERVEEAAEALEDLEGRFRDDTLGLHGSATLCAARATFAKEKGEPELAEERYEACLERFPGPGVVVQEAVSFYDEQQRPERAEAVLARALEQEPGAHGFRTVLALRMRTDGRSDEAEALLREGTELETPVEAAESWANLAAFLIEEGRSEEALDAYTEARRLVPDPGPQLLFSQAEALVVAGRNDEALEVAEAMSIPAHAELVRGRVDLARDDPEAALEHFDEGVRLWPNNAVARYFAARAAERSGDFERAVEDYRYAMRIDVTATDAYLRLARLHEAAGRDDYALNALAFMPGGRPEEKAAALLHLELLARAGRKTPEHVRRSLTDPESWSAALAAIAAGVRTRAGPEAGAAYLSGVEGDPLSDPRHAEAIEALVHMQAEAGRPEAGLRHLEELLAAHPDEAALHALHGVASGASGAPPEAQREYFERALELDAEEPRALLGLARLEAEADRGEAALALYERAAAVRPDDGERVRETAALLAKLGRSDEAEQRLVEHLREVPWDGRSALALAELRLARGAGPERTRELAQRAVRFGGGDPARALLERIDGAAAANAGSAEG